MFPIETNLIPLNPRVLLGYLVIQNVGLPQKPQCFQRTLQLPHSREVCGFLEYACVCFTVCGRVCVHGRVGSDANKLHKVFQDEPSA